MTLDTATQLGKIIGTLVKNQQITNENISPEEADSALLLKTLAGIELSGTVTVTRNNYAATSFIIDHPTRGVIDSPTLEIDGGYDGAGTTLYTVSF